MIKKIHSIIPILTNKYSNYTIYNQFFSNYKIYKLITPILKINNYINIKKNFISNNKTINNINNEIKNLDDIQGTINYSEDGLYVLKCVCNICNNHIIKKFSKKAYNEGIVIINCDKCKNYHLISDRIGWFNDEDNSNIDIFKLLNDKQISIN